MAKIIIEIEDTPNGLSPVIMNWSPRPPIADPDNPTQAEIVFYRIVKFLDQDGLLVSSPFAQPPEDEDDGEELKKGCLH